MTSINIIKPCRVTTPDGGVLDIMPGLQDLPPGLANHWYVKAHSTEPGETFTKQAPVDGIRNRQQAMADGERELTLAKAAQYLGVTIEELRLAATHVRQEKMRAEVGALAPGRAPVTTVTVPVELAAPTDPDWQEAQGEEPGPEPAPRRRAPRRQKETA